MAQLEIPTAGELSIQRTVAEAMEYNALRRNMYRTATRPDMVLPLGTMTTAEVVQLREHTLDVFTQDMFVYDDELARREPITLSELAAAIVASNEDPANWPM